MASPIHIEIRSRWKIDNEPPARWRESALKCHVSCQLYCWHYTIPASYCARQGGILACRGVYCHTGVYDCKVCMGIFAPDSVDCFTQTKCIHNIHPWLTQYPPLTSGVLADTTDWMSRWLWTLGGWSKSWPRTRTDKILQRCSQSMLVAPLDSCRYTMVTNKNYYLVIYLDMDENRPMTLAASFLLLNGMIFITSQHKFWIFTYIIRIMFVCLCGYKRVWWISNI